MYEYKRAEEEIPKIEIDPDTYQYVEWFWDIRGLCGSYETPVTMPVIKGWQEHTYNVLQRWERDAIFDMDRAFRHAYADVLRWHSKRPQIKLEDSDRKKLNGHRRARV